MNSTSNHPPGKAAVFVRHKKSLFAASLVAIVLIILISVKLTGVNTVTNADSEAGKNQPDYQTVLPTGRTIEQLGGWHRVSPDGAAAVFAYSDTINKVEISVSQQSLPSILSSDDGSRLAELAKRFSATKKLTTASGVAYIGTSAKGPQSVILAKGSTLVLIKSQAHIDDEAWIAYIDSLGLSY